MPLYRDLVDTNLYEVIKVQTCSGHPLTVTAAGTTQSDAFGRLRTSDPFTLFDSSHRYDDNGLWATSTGVSGAAVFNEAQGLVDLNVTSASGSKVLRETKTVAAYQPGKSLLALNTFVMAPAKTNLRQRVGYFNANNGFYLELNNSILSWVKRTNVSGSVQEFSIPQSEWNLDRLDGSGPSKLVLDITKAQIAYLDVEWLGVGNARLGFIIDGEIIICHVFRHANTIATTYMTTASLPLRYEIENTGSTSGNSTLKQICSTVISEGGYELRGKQNAVTTSLSGYDLTSAATDYPVASLRLKASPDRLDAIVLPSALSLLGTGNNGLFIWKIVRGGTTVSGAWTAFNTDSAVEYNLSGTSISGGEVLAAGYLSSSNQSATPVDILKDSLFGLQLRRDPFTSTPEELTVVVSSKNAGDDVHVALDWQEVSH